LLVIFITWPLSKVVVKPLAREDRLLMAQLASWRSLPEQISGTRPSDMIDLDPLDSIEVDFVFRGHDALMIGACSLADLPGMAAIATIRRWRSQCRSRS